jgi:hypothetical protein
MALFRAVVLSCLSGFLLISALAQSPVLPPFGRDTVLVYKSEIEDGAQNFVVRIAEFRPDRFIEWEDAKTQGTIFMPAASLESGRAFLNSKLFEAGMDTKGKNATTLWLSVRMFRDIVDKKRAKIGIDGIDTWVTLEGRDEIPVEVNRSLVQVSAIKTKDDRQSERWFYDSEENPILLKHSVRNYRQTLTSITTDRANTLRWIKGKKVPHP